MYIQTSVNNSVINTVLNYNYDPIGNRSSFIVPTLGIINNFGLYFNTSETVTTLKLPNVVQNYTKYNIYNDLAILILLNLLALQVLTHILMWSLRVKYGQL